MRNIFLRIFCGIILLGGIFFLPWPIYSVMAVLCMVFFSWYWEAVIAAFLIDGFSSTQSAEIYSRFGFVILASLILLAVIENVKSKIRYEV